MRRRILRSNNGPIPVNVSSQNNAVFHVKTHHGRELSRLSKQTNEATIELPLTDHRHDHPNKPTNMRIVPEDFLPSGDAQPQIAERRTRREVRLGMLKPAQVTALVPACNRKQELTTFDGDNNIRFKIHVTDQKGAEKPTKILATLAKGAPIQRQDGMVKYTRSGFHTPTIREIGSNEDICELDNDQSKEKLKWSKNAHDLWNEALVRNSENSYSDRVNLKTRTHHKFGNTYENQQSRKNRRHVERQRKHTRKEQPVCDYRNRELIPDCELPSPLQSSSTSNATSEDSLTRSNETGSNYYGSREHRRGSRTRERYQQGASILKTATPHAVSPRRLNDNPFYAHDNRQLSRLQAPFEYLPTVRHSVQTCVTCQYTPCSACGTAICIVCMAEPCSSCRAPLCSACTIESFSANNQTLCVSCTLEKFPSYYNQLAYNRSASTGEIPRHHQPSGNVLMPQADTGEELSNRRSPDLSEYQTSRNVQVIRGPTNLPTIDLPRGVSPHGTPHNEPAVGPSQIIVPASGPPRVPLSNKPSNELIANQVPRDMMANQAGRNMIPNQVPREMVANQVAREMMANQVARDMGVNQMPRDMGANQIPRDMVANQVPRDVVANQGPREMVANQASRGMGPNQMPRDMVTNQVPRDVVANQVTRDMVANQTSRDIRANQAVRNLPTYLSPSDFQSSYPSPRHAPEYRSRSALPPGYPCSLSPCSPFIDYSARRNLPPLIPNYVCELNPYTPCDPVPEDLSYPSGSIIPRKNRFLQLMAGMRPSGSVHSCPSATSCCCCNYTQEDTGDKAPVIYPSSWVACARKRNPYDARYGWYEEESGVSTVMHVMWIVVPLVATYALGYYGMIRLMALNKFSRLAAALANTTLLYILNLEPDDLIVYPTDKPNIKQGVGRGPNMLSCSPIACSSPTTGAPDLDLPCSENYRSAP
ncbi:DNA polymerase III subunits gamma and tau domain-containing protein [Elysia marginata]|uniref:DNA polymerase III subunits gamma and tau domain-containing protein n=1 Tax=Elysia marginata TaxID=1093978 RepID=A0AAV4IMI9_9GAST|nr:DNA polymerase III subunits gamma and tau domain-containing protein [Elysia marginata]